MNTISYTIFLGVCKLKKNKLPLATRLMSRVGLGTTDFHEGFTGPRGGGGRGAGCVNVDLVLEFVGEFPFGLDVGNEERPFNVVDFSATPRATPLDMPFVGIPLGPLAKLQIRLYFCLYN